MDIKCILTLCLDSLVNREISANLITNTKSQYKINRFTTRLSHDNSLFSTIQIQNDETICCLLQHNPTEVTFKISMCSLFLIPSFIYITLNTEILSPCLISLLVASPQTYLQRSPLYASLTTTRFKIYDKRILSFHKYIKA